MKKSIFFHLICLMFSQFFLISLARADIPSDLLESAQNGKASSQYAVARAYELGKRVKSDNDKAIEWYAKAADQGHLEAAYRLGLIYYKGVGGFDIDLKKAFYYISMAAEGGHKRSQAHLAQMYEDGDGVEADEVLSDYWYEQAFSAKTQALKEYLKNQKQNKKSVTVKVLKKSVSEPVNPVVIRSAIKAEKSKPVAVVEETITYPDSIMSQNWFQGKVPSAYLKSSGTKCRFKNEKVSCSSSKLHGSHPTGMYKYRIKTLISQIGESADIQLEYRKLYLSVPEERIGGYDDEPEVEQANGLTLGWEKKSHIVSCSFETASSVLCRPVGEDAFYIRAR